jgi:hypothetical protein
VLSQGAGLFRSPVPISGIGQRHRHWLGLDRRGRYKNEATDKGDNGGLK